MDKAEGAPSPAGGRYAERLAGMIMRAEEALAANPAAAGTAIADATAAFKRVVARAATLPAEYERVEFVQRRGPRVEFTGRLLAETEAPGTDGVAILQVWGTEGGALVATREWHADSDADDMQVEVVPPRADPLAMRLAVMEFFRWL